MPDERAEAQQAAEKLRAGNQWRDSGLLFATEFGTPVEPRNILRTIGLAAKKARWMCKPAWAEPMPSEGGIYRTRAEHVVQNHCGAADYAGLIAVGGRQNS